jgi:hypothetical protein
MSTYTYTNTNNTIKLVAGPIGPKGTVGDVGTTGTTGAAGVQGAKGPGNLGRTDISFSSNISPAYKEIPVGKIVLIGHTTTNNLPTLSSVKAIIGADTGDTVCRAGLYLVNHSTENSGAATPMIIASSKFEIKGLGRTKDFKIADFDIDASAWPTNDDVIGLWAYIEYPKDKINSYLAEVERLYGAREAVTVKEALQKEVLLTRTKFYSSLEGQYGIKGGGILTEEQNVLKEAEQLEVSKTKLTLDAAQTEEIIAAEEEQRRTLDYTTISSSSLDLQTWVSANITLEVAYLQFS